MSEKLARGTQIIYVPQHAEGDEEHLDCERGFVTSMTRGSDVFCRYWSRHSPMSLRTKANSELTSIELLVVKDTVPQAQVEAALERWC